MATADRPTGQTSWTVGDRLRQARCSARLTLRQMGERLGVSTAVVNGYEQQATPIPQHVIAGYAEVTRVSADWLRTGTGQSPPLYGEPPR